ncbi:MAG: hypothetical protein LKH59_02835 [Lactobacillus crispatus]|jgi:hypothetical protein|uniref:hypothetical protein n=1 Tax=Lactobacillus crispatus TaxID=47770 RepID=UPI0018AC6DFC|nr:hypothetical protein [Lactobacillus crispatus]MCH4005260.1 hypothetical protein [Lactobacillus crispatus]MCI1335086.1 hypothetical protein [Lactobacillus crispatus]MCI1364440.1 hypothetical protein [Lactobacillus crispatus]MCI1492911.1 hypothetical protein [Lactobacillus crispatus]MCI1523572.1 hypothetical protein [Lactobacillus crispatus]
MFKQNKIIGLNNKKINNKNYILPQKDEELLNLFQANLLNETVLYPFYPVRHINKKFVKFISNSGKPLFNDFVFQPKTRNLILDTLMVISYKYLAKNKAEMDYSDLRKNWVNVFNLSFCTNDIKFNKEALLNKIDEANKM